MIPPCGFDHLFQVGLSPPTSPQLQRACDPCLVTVNRAFLRPKWLLESWTETQLGGAKSGPLPEPMGMKHTLPTKVALVG